MDPESRARGHSRKMGVNMANPQLLQAQADLHCLIKPKEIGPSSPFIERDDNF